MVRNKRGADVLVGDGILIQPGEVGTVTRAPLVLETGRVFIHTDRALLTGSLDDQVRVVAEGCAE